MKDLATLDELYKLNLTYFKELSMYILAGKKKLGRSAPPTAGTAGKGQGLRPSGGCPGRQ